MSQQSVSARGVAAGPASSAPAPPLWWPRRPQLGGGCRHHDAAQRGIRSKRQRGRGLNASSSSMEVQNANSGQTTVGWTSTTQFSKTVTKAVSAVLDGECVTVTGTPSKKSKTTIAARSITVRSATSSGSCAGFGTPNGSGAPGQRPAGRRAASSSEAVAAGRASAGSNAEGGGTFGRGGTGNGSSNFRQQLASIAIASGKVKSVKGSTLTVSGFSLNPGQFTRGVATSGSKATKPTPPKTEILTITTSKSTTVSATQSAAATDLAVGDCVSAFGPAASNGAVTANSVRITSTGGASCTAGFGRFGGGPGGGFFGGTGGAVAAPESSAGWGRTGHRRAVLIGAVVLVVVLGGGAAAWAEVVMPVPATGRARSPGPTSPRP